jgi:putative intracellular protease/amidase
LVPLPNAGFDPSEVAVAWSALADNEHEVVFATPDGTTAVADPIMLSGEGLDPWGFVPGLRKVRAVGLILRADRAARAAYARMATDPRFSAPARYDAVRAQDFDALLLPGGHAKEMRNYLESAILQQCVVDFFEADKPVGAICHGALLAARSISPRTGRSVLHGRKTTSLTWALERKAWNVGRIVRFWDPSYYRTYGEAPGEPAGHWSVQSEVTRALASPQDYLEPIAATTDGRLKTDGMHRDSATDSRPAFVVEDGNYVSARWPGDAHTFALAFAARLR